MFDITHSDKFTTYQACACVCICMCISKRMQSKCKMYGIALQRWEKSGLCEGKLLLILLISHSVGLEDILQGSWTRTHTNTTHTRPGQSPEASVATWWTRIMTSIMSSYSEGEREERELLRKKAREKREREHFPFLGCRSPIVARPAGAFSPRLQLIGCPTMWGGWLRGS